MNPLTKLQNMFKRKAFDPMANLDLDKIGWHKLGGSSTYAEYKQNDYENAYPAISKIAYANMVVEPFAVDKNGEKIKQTNIIDVLYSPNEDMSAVDFREALMIMTSVHAKVRLQVHKKEGAKNFTEENITGFTFIENAVERVIDGVRTYHLPNGKTLTDGEVITLKSINPYALNEGFSPSESARKWIAVDDYIAMYQQGFFQNGAVPAGQFVITAKTSTDFNDIVDKLEQQHKGAGKNNNVSYVHRPTDATGKAQQAQIEWIPFNQSNKDMNLNSLFEQANKKIDSAYGVPASIRGVNDNNTYASVRVDEVIFVKYVVDPLLLKLYGKLTHELNRITGGLGLAITYELDIPSVADEEKVKAEATAVEVGTITTLVNAGYTLESIVEALKLDEDYKLLKIDKTRPAPVAPPSIDQPEVLDNNEADDLEEVDNKDNPKALSPQARANYENQLTSIVAEQKRRQVQRALDDLDGKRAKAYYATDEEIKAFTHSMYSSLELVLNAEGAHQMAVSAKVLTDAGLSDVSMAFQLTPEQIKAYKAYVKKVGLSYTDTVGESIRTIIQRADEQGLNAGQLRSQLNEVSLETYQVRRLVVTEINRAGSEASVFAMDNISKELDVKIYKIWNVNAGACEYCQAMHNKKELTSETFVKKGDSVTGVDGGIYKNDFTDIGDSTLHPNCGCYVTYEVIR